MNPSPSRTGLAPSTPALAARKHAHGKAHLTRCLSCGATQLADFYQLRGIPVHSCLLMRTRDEARAIARRDLQLAWCPVCGFVQNRVFDPHVHSYSQEYEETQAYSGTFNDFAERLARRWIGRYDIRSKRVLEIGCGKGEFLVRMCELGANHGLGVDPGYRPERTETDADVRFEQSFFAPEHLEFAPDVILCRHTLEHVSPVREFMQTLRAAIGDRTGVVLLFELPAVERVLEECAFEDVYYEHCSYFSLGSLARLFRTTGFEVLRLETDFDGQYLLIDAVPFAGERSPQLLDECDLARLERGVAEFRSRAPMRIGSFAEELRTAHARGERTVLWGSGSKAVAFLTSTGLRDEIEVTVDINPHKQGRYLPATGQVVVAPEFLREYRPDRVILMNRIYLAEVRAQLDELGLRPRLDAL